jgi:hypothetical protein
MVMRCSTVVELGTEVESSGAKILVQRDSQCPHIGSSMHPSTNRFRTKGNIDHA